MIWTRRIGGFLLAIAAAVVWFTMAPDTADVKSHSSELAEILDNAEANNALAEGAPQQEVVNGWATRDLLALSVAQNDELSEQQQRDPRPGALLGLMTLGVALLAVITPERSATVAVTGTHDPASLVSPSSPTEPTPRDPAPR